MRSTLHTATLVRQHILRLDAARSVRPFYEQGRSAPLYGMLKILSKDYSISTIEVPARRTD
jgi:hypothetical protein